MQSAKWRVGDGCEIKTLKTGGCLETMEIVWFHKTCPYLPLEQFLISLIQLQRHGILASLIQFFSQVMPKQSKQSCCALSLKKTICIGHWKIMVATPLSLGTRCCIRAMKLQSQSQMQLGGFGREFGDSKFQGRSNILCGKHAVMPSPQKWIWWDKKSRKLIHARTVIGIQNPLLMLCGSVNQYRLFGLCISGG